MLRTKDPSWLEGKEGGQVSLKPLAMWMVHSFLNISKQTWRTIDPSSPQEPSLHSFKRGDVTGKSLRAPRATASVSTSSCSEPCRLSSQCNESWSFGLYLRSVISFTTCVTLSKSLSISVPACLIHKSCDVEEITSSKSRDHIDPRN